MPFITLSTLFILAGVFTGGCLISWYLNDRKNERERDRLEKTMTEALHKRYQVYEDLEDSFHRIFSRMDEIRERWQEQMTEVQASVAGSLGETTFVREGVEDLVGRVDAMGGELHQKMEAVLEMARSMPMAMSAAAAENAASETRVHIGSSHALMRAESPELWDLEREFEARNAEQLAEISAKSLRVTELMDKIEALEPMGAQLAERDREFVALEAERNALQEKVTELEEVSEQLAGTNRALEDTRRARTAELTHRIEELELISVEAVELRKQIETRRVEAEGLVSSHKAEVNELECKVAEVSIELEAVRQEQETAVEVAGEERVRFEGDRIAFEKELEQREQEMQELRVRISDLEARAEGLTSEVSSRDEILADKEANLNELQSQLTNLQSELEERASELDEREHKFQELQNAWQQATGQVESQRSRLQAHLGSFHAAQEMLSQLKPMLEELETRLVTDEPDVEESSATGLDELPESCEEVVDEGILDLPAESVSLDELPAALPATDLVDEAKAEEADVSMETYGDASFDREND